MVSEIRPSALRFHYEQPTTGMTRDSGAATTRAETSVLHQSGRSQPVTPRSPNPSRAQPRQSPPQRAGWRPIALATWPRGTASHQDPLNAPSSEQHSRHRAHPQREVEPYAPVLDVVEVEPDHRVKGERRATSRHGARSTAAGTHRSRTCASTCPRASRAGRSSS